MPSLTRKPPGFTLIEVLVGLAILALLTAMSWRGLDGMLRSQEHLRERSAELASLQAALAQWTLDLQQAAETPYLNAIAWDGQQLRIVRRSLTEEALVVVAWGQRSAPGALQWRRWQSPPVRDRKALLQAWKDAPAGLQQDRPASGAAVTLVALTGWEVQFHQGAGWAKAPSLSPVATADPQLIEPPVGVRLLLQLPAGSLAGALQLDWANPSQNRGRS